MSCFAIDLPTDLAPQDMSQFLTCDDSELPHSTSAVQSPLNTPSAVKKTKWTPDEDALLTESVHEHGMTNWTLISQSVPGRNGKQCRERWTNQLCPSLNKENWTHQEDITLLQQQRIYGNVWSQVARFLPGRSPSSVKNRWSWLSRHRLSLSGPQLPLPCPAIQPPVLSDPDQTAPPDLLWGIHRQGTTRGDSERVAFSDPAVGPAFSFPPCPPTPIPLPQVFQSSGFLTFDEDPPNYREAFREPSPFGPRGRDLGDDSCALFDDWARF
jgi:hypothetical protein